MEKMEKMRNEKSKMQKRKRSIRDDERAVSPVIGVIMMIAIVVIVSAVVAAFAYGIIGSVQKAPSSALVVEGVHAGEDVEVTIFHHGGDTITGAFNGTEGSTNLGDKWAHLEVRLNGSKVAGTNTSGVASNLCMNGTAYTKAWKKTFEPADEIKIKFRELGTDDTIVILHTPSDSILQRITVI